MYTDRMIVSGYNSQALGDFVVFLENIIDNNHISIIRHPGKPR